MNRRRFLKNVVRAATVVPAGVLAHRSAGAEPWAEQARLPKIGCCGSQIATGSDGTGIESIETLKALGFDYIELPLTSLMSLDEAAFADLENRIKASDLPCESCNNFLPSDVRVTGPNVNSQRIAAYIEPAFRRASRLGVKVIVCGSCGSRSLPLGYSPGKAWAQMVSFLRTANKTAADHGITIAIEAINREECNFLNLSSDGLRLAKDVNCSNIKLLVDYFHWALEKEGTDVLLAAGDYIRHIHVGRPEGRVFPKASDPDDYGKFFGSLRKLKYHHRISIEAKTRDLKQDGAESLALLRGFFG
jgi:D-psicose/D-tagatose/L-ribulose 3-epimerase